MTRHERTLESARGQYRPEPGRRPRRRGGGGPGAGYRPAARLDAGRDHDPRGPREQRLRRTRSRRRHGGRPGDGRDRRGDPRARARAAGRQRRLDPGRDLHPDRPRHHRDASRHLRLQRQLGFRSGGSASRTAPCAFLATVVSRPAPDRAVLDAGSKSLAMDPSRATPATATSSATPRSTIVQLSEEHGVVHAAAGRAGIRGRRPGRGHPQPRLPDRQPDGRALIVRDGRIVDTWRVAARGKVR